MDERRSKPAEDRRVHERVIKLEESMEAHLVEHTQFVSLLSDSIRNVEAASNKMAVSMNEIADVLKVYNNTRGFITTMKVVGATIFWIAAIGGSLAAIGASIRFWIKS